MKKIQRVLLPICCAVLGGIGGYFLGLYVFKGADNRFLLLEIAFLLFGILAAVFVNMILHEAGHLIAGLLSGYRFCSFRVGSFMWISTDGKIRFRRFSLAGTGGQCLMVPPDMTEDGFPTTLYHFGGAIMNLITGLLFLLLFFVTKPIRLLSEIFLLLSVFAFVSAVQNGIPMRLGMIDNDGYNALMTRRDRTALRGFWIQLKVNEMNTKGQRLREMPEEWFVHPTDEEMKNSMAAAVGIFCCNRLTDIGDFAEADRQMEHDLSIPSGIVGIHRQLLICDRMYIEMITENRRDVIDAMDTKEHGNFMKAMKTFPSVIRTEYAYALLVKKDFRLAGEILTRFNRCEKTYPYPSEIQSERELMQLADKTVQKNK